MYKGEAWKVEELADTAAHISQHPLWVRGHYENLEPIPITEEALVKMGFTKAGQNIYSFPKKYYLISSKDGKFYIDVSCTPFNSNLIKLISIHQLCNLFYSLTQTELSYD